MKIAANEPAAKGNDISKLKSFSNIDIPLDYIEVVQEMTGIEINNDSFLRIWGPSDCIELNKAYQVQKYIGQSLVIGDDEGGAAIAYMNGKNGFGIYKIDFGDLDKDEAIYVSSTLTNILIHGDGLD